ncbi:PEP-CTERM sorting domain-containing protein [Roseateles sp. LYH14W]|uniref:PEP-CTERM sorting domain-containing protein n=1 Tax=Pelomonas parva TaxID=3299032 RepID=A0ABW7FAB6_9BURK
MKFRLHTLAALLLGAAFTQAQAGATTEVAYTALAGPTVSFIELVANPFDVASLDGLLSSGGVLFGERFAGQELAEHKAPRPGEEEVAQDWFDDLSNGAPTAGLTLLAGAAGANLGAYHYGDADGAALFGVGPQPGNGDGFGAISARFALPVSALGLQLRDLHGGAITLSLYRLDGSLIEAVDLSGRADGQVAFARSGGAADIAGFSLTHADPHYGVSIDNLVLSAAPVPEPASALLLLGGLALLGTAARRRPSNT